MSMRVPFDRQMAQIVRNVRQDYDELKERCIQHIGRSIMYGSHVTGAPGQPVRSGELLASWHREGDAWLSRAKHARIIEDNLRGATLRSKVGGFHSVKLTRNGFKRIVEYELLQMGVNTPTRGRSGRFTRGTYDARGRGSKIRDPKTGRWMKS